MLSTLGKSSIFYVLCKAAGKLNFLVFCSISLYCFYSQIRCRSHFNNDDDIVYRICSPGKKENTQVYCIGLKELRVERTEADGEYLRSHPELESIIGFALQVYNTLPGG